MDDKIVIVTGGFDPLHSGHISLISEARKHGRVVIGLNSDDWLIRKKGKSFLSFDERYKILSNLRDVMWVIDFNDSDGTAIDVIRKTKDFFVKNKIVFANGGDRTTENVPELDYCKENNIDVIFGVGGQEKKNSSSWILSDWTCNNFENRIWGKFKTLYTNGQKVKVKELTLEPKKSISLQKHKFRTEYWVVLEGYGEVTLNENKKQIKTGDSVLINPEEIHKLRNTGVVNLKLIEIQHGENCDESDIERFE